MKNDAIFGVILTKAYHSFLRFVLQIKYIINKKYYYYHRCALRPLKTVSLWSKGHKIGPLEISSRLANSSWLKICYWWTQHLQQVEQKSQDWIILIKVREIKLKQKQNKDFYLCPENQRNAGSGFWFAVCLKGSSCERKHLLNLNFDGASQPSTAECFNGQLWVFQKTLEVVTDCLYVWSKLFITVVSNKPVEPVNEHFGRVSQEQTREFLKVSI